MAYFRNCSKLHKGKGNILRVENIHAPTKVFTSYFECLTNFKNAGADVTNDPLSGDFRRVYLSNLQKVFVQLQNVFFQFQSIFVPITKCGATNTCNK